MVRRAKHRSGFPSGRCAITRTVMRRLIHLMLSPSCRLARLVVAEKRVACDPAHAEDAAIPCRSSSIWTAPAPKASGRSWIIWNAIIPTIPWRPRTRDERRASLRWLDWAMGPFHEQVTQRIVYEKAGQRFTGAPASPRARHECDPRRPRGIETGAGRDRPGGRKRTAICPAARHAWAIWRWRRICRRWIISAKCPGANFPPPANGMCG